MNQALFLPSFSMRSYSRDLWLLSRDAHATQALAMAKHLKEWYTVSMVVPKNHDLHDLPENVELIVDPHYGTNIVERRYSVSPVPDSLNSEYNLVLNGHIEHASKVKERFPTSNVASILTHGPLINKKYLYDNEDNLNASDVVFYNFSRKLLPDNRKWFRKLYQLYNYADGDLVTFKRPTKIPGSVLFLSRFTDASRFDVPNMIALLEDLTKSHDVWYTDPSESPSTVPKGAKKLHQRNKKDFIGILDWAETVIIPYSIEMTYSVSYFEALARGCKVITLKCEDHFVPFNNKYSLQSMDDLKLKIDEPYDPQTLQWAQKFYVSRPWCWSFKESHMVRRENADKQR